MAIIFDDLPFGYEQYLSTEEQREAVTRSVVAPMDSRLKE